MKIHFFSSIKQVYHANIAKSSCIISLFLIIGVLILAGLVLVVKSYRAFSKYRKEQMERYRAEAQNQPQQPYIPNQPQSQPQFEAPPAYNDQMSSYAIGNQGTSAPSVQSATIMKY